MILSGDTLFVAYVGRPHFGGPEGATHQFWSTHRLLDAADWVEVFPAHSEGLWQRDVWAPEQHDCL